MMKKVVAIVVAVLMVTVVFAACQNTPAASSAPASESVAASQAEASSEAPASEAKQLVFADLAWDMSNMWNQYDVEAFKWAAEQKGVTVKVGDGQNDPEKQVSQAQQFINEGVDGIICFPVTPDDAATIVRMANEAGIPIAIENIFLSDEAAQGVVGQVACQYRDIGYAAIKYAAENYPGCKLFYMKGGLGIGCTEDYVIGVDKALEEFKDKVTLVGSGVGEWKTDVSQNVMQDFISSGKSEFDVVFAQCGLTTKGVSNALKANGMEGIPIISTGGSPLDYEQLLSGDEAANMTAPVCIQGEIAFRYLWQAVNGVEITDPKIVLPVIPVDSKNIDTEWLAWDDYEGAYDYIGGITP